MSSWGNNFHTNGNQNSSGNPDQNYHIGDNRSSENWTNYGLPQNLPQPFSSSASCFTNNSAVNNQGPNYSGFDYFSHQQQSCQNGASLSMYNTEISSDILARAANSQLTATAGEFIPNSSYQSSSFSTQDGRNQDNQSNRTQRSSAEGRNYASNRSSRSQEQYTSSKNKNQDVHYQGRRNFDQRSKPPNTNNSRQFSMEQSKAEGRKKLLQEAAGLVQPSINQAGPSRSAAPSSDSPRWRSNGNKFADRSSQRNSFEGDNKAFNRSGRTQEQYHQTRRSSPPRRSQTVISPRKDRTKGVDDAASQRERLTEQLNRGALECLVCCDVVRQTDHTWSCHNCYHVLHLRCIIKWANTSKAENGWRCPACQNVTGAIPQDYYCFCGKRRNPEWTRTDTAHSCGEVCDRAKVLASEHYSCAHRCNLLCHPGPCPQCLALVKRKCGCGRTTQSVQCGQTVPLVCKEICDKPLACGNHQCNEPCHLGKCQPCQVIITLVCFCGKVSKEVKCDGESQEGARFSCADVCGGPLACGQHQCEQVCHAGACGDCERDPALVTRCPCSKTPLQPDQHRNSCLDPIPTCGQPCARPLACGQPSSPHECKALCHEGVCPPCDRYTLVRCRCGFMDKEIPCTQLTTKADDARCQKKCTKKRSCGKHKCNQLCCIDLDHVCPLPCNHMLSCGNHRCDQLCHRGHCQACLQSSFTELYCECGSNVLLPPIPCGTRPPVCNNACTRDHGCDHPVLHNCHSYPACPPCSILTAKYCYGKHELRRAVPCHMKQFSCGLACGRALPCGRHKCIQPCHGGECATPCKQPCTHPRELCGHACNAPCHNGPCVDTPCKEKVIVTCECGHRSMSRPCFENNSEYQRIATSLLASKMADVQLGRSVNLNDMAPRKFTIKTLECSDECRIIERNRRLAIGLQIRNPDLTAKLTPRYSDFMRTWAKKDQRFCQHVHDKLTELVKLAKESKQKSRSYSFETMNREKRQFVHEYCSHFGCESVAYDAEPKRNVVATAHRDKAWLPSYSLPEVVQREMGLRKVPLPNLNSSTQKSSQSEVLPVRVTLNPPAAKPAVPEPSPPQIDYFDLS